MYFLFVSCRITLGDRLRQEQQTGVIRKSGASVGEKEITFRVKKASLMHTPNTVNKHMNEQQTDSLNEYLTACLNE